jgi:hypothetical protein
MARAEKELERQKEAAEQRKNQKRMPFRFFVDVGETKQIVICDEKPDFFRYEHTIKGATGKFNVQTGCVKENDNCPVCETTNKESYYAMYLTCLDLTPFKTKDGTKVEFSRKLLVVKPAQQKKIIRLYRKEKTLRGMILDMTRDENMDPAIGNDIEFVDWMEEKELAGYTRSWKDRDGKKHTENCDEPYDYEELFPEQTADELREIVGGRPAPGSKEADREALSESRRRPKRRSEEEEDADGWDKDEEEEAPWDEDEKPARGKRGRPSAEEEEEEERPARGRRGKPAEEEEEEEPAPRGRRRPAKDEEEEEAPAPRRAGRVRRDESVEEEEEAPAEEEEEAPVRGRRITPRRARKEEADEEEEAPRTARRSRR